jgi:hypothetical protein
VIQKSLGMNKVNRESPCLPKIGNRSLEKGLAGPKTRLPTTQKRQAHVESEQFRDEPQAKDRAKQKCEPTSRHPRRRSSKHHPVPSIVGVDETPEHSDAKSIAPRRSQECQDMDTDEPKTSRSRKSEQSKDRPKTKCESSSRPSKLLSSKTNLSSLVGMDKHPDDSEVKVIVMPMNRSRRGKRTARTMLIKKST